MKKKKGLTLIEILAIVVILGILSLIAVVSINRIQVASKLKSAEASAKAYVNGLTAKLLVEENENLDVRNVNDNSLQDVVENQDKIDGLVATYKDRIIQARFCIDGYSIDYDEGKYKTIENSKNCNLTTKNGGIAYKNLNGNNKIVGLAYKNPNYEKQLKYAKMNNYEVYPSKVIYDEISALRLNSNLPLTGSYGNKIKTVANDNLPEKYDSRELGYTTPTKNQRQLGLCWAYSAVGAVETKALMQGYGELDLSERQLDYFSSDSSAFVNNYNGYGNETKDNNYRKQFMDRKLGSGGNDLVSIYTFFTGLSLQTNEEFHDDYDLNKKDYYTIYNSNKVSYYVKEAEILSSPNTSDNEDIELVNNYIKQKIVENGSITATLRSADINEFNGTLYGKQAYIYSNVNRRGGHEALIIGWDDNVPYTDENGNRKKGAWIAKNSWVDEREEEFNNAPLYLAYFYISYDANTIIDGKDDHHYDEGDYDYLTINEVGKKDWDKSYDFLNNGTKIENKQERNVMYYNKPDNNIESIVKIGYMNYYSKASNLKLYVYDVKNASYCNNNENKIIDNGNGTITVDGKVYNGFSLDVNFNHRGYKIFDINNNNNFKNNICVISSSEYFNGNVSIFTKETDKKLSGDSEIVNIDSKKIYISTAFSNGKDTGKLTAKYGDESMSTIYKEGTMDVLNNVTHEEIPKSILPTTYPYYIRTDITNPNTKETSISLLKVNKDLSFENVIPLCIIYNNTYYVKNGNTVNISVICKGDNVTTGDLSSYISLSNENFELVESKSSIVNGNSNYVFTLKSKSSNKNETKVTINKDIHKSNDNYESFDMNTNLMSLNNSIVSCKIENPYSINKVRVNKKTKVNIICTSTVDILNSNEKDIVGKVTAENSKILKIEDLKLESIEQKKVTYSVIVKALKRGMTSIVINSGFVTDIFGTTNQTISGYTIEVAYTTGNKVDCKIEKDFNDIKVGEQKQATLTCTTKTEFEGFSTDNVKNNITFNHSLSLQNIELVYKSKNKLQYKLDINGYEKGTFAYIILNKNAIRTIDGYYNSRVKSSNIKVKDSDTPGCEINN